ncbi:FAD-binding protein [Alteromonadaceae bacterium BrNp21-10]|nr:FAD-binding protein [Alteromonadaceae bacterium BrNp21-10]
MSVLIIAEHDNQSVKIDTHKTVTAALQMDADCHILIIGHDCQSAAEQAASIDGISKMIVADNSVYQYQLAENCAEVVLALAPAYSHIVTPATTNGKNLLPRVAALLDVQQISDIIAVLSADTFMRPIYAGNAIATVQSSDSKKLISVRSSAFAAATSGNATASIEQLSTVNDNALSAYVSAELSKSERPELAAASVVISGGRGMQNGDNFSLLEAVADKLGAAIGASRAAVDAGFVSNDLQVGQTGKIVAPELYIAVGISGAIQHLAGMKDSKVIVAINKDEDAPIFQVADYGLVGDLFTVLPELASKL